MKKTIKVLLIILGIIYPILIITIFASIDIANIWNSWGLQNNDNNFIYPDFGNYILLILFKLSIYVIPSLIISGGLSIENKQKINKKKYFYYFLYVLNIWFLVLLTIKLLSDSIFELDRIWNFKIFDSIKDVQTLIGFVVTFILKKNYKIETNIPNAKVIKESIEKELQ